MRQANFSLKSRTSPLLPWLGPLRRFPVDCHDRRIEELYFNQPFGQTACGLDRLGQALAHPLLHHQAVDDDGDVVLVLLVEDDPALLVEPAELAIDDRAGVALPAHLLEQLPVLALASAHERRQDHEPRALLQHHDAVGDLLERLPLDRLAAVVTVGVADPSPEQAEVIVDLRHGPHRRARVARCGLLVDRDRRREALDRVDVGLLHLAEELARVGGERLDVAALTLGVDRVEGEAGLARSREPGDDDQRVARDRQIDPLQVVRARSGDDDFARASHERFSVRIRTAVPLALAADPAAPGREAEEAGGTY